MTYAADKAQEIVVAWASDEQLHLNNESGTALANAIAAASPSVILAILAELDALRVEYRRVSIEAGEWPCATVEPANAEDDEEGFVCTHSQQDHRFQQHSRVVVRNCLAMVNDEQCRCWQYTPKESV